MYNKFKMSLVEEDEDEDSIARYLKNNKLEKSNDEAKIDIDKEKREEEEILKQYEKIGNLKDNESIKESEMTKNYDSNGNKYYNEYY